MPTYNKVILIGNLTRDPELKQAGQTQLCTVGLALNRTWKNDRGEKCEEVTFVDVTLFGRTAQNVAQYMRKGSALLVEGRLRTESWQDKQTGKNRSKLSVVGESVQFLGGAKQTDVGQGKPATTETDAPAAEQNNGVPF